ncbi:hypothetical protein JCM8097_006521 [Rhodosporidiobolus ruineniae]
MSEEALQPRFPSTLAPPAYYDGLVDRLTDALLPVLAPYFSTAAPAKPKHLLELASGNGTHSALFARTWPGLVVRPTECDDFGCSAVDQTSEKEGVSLLAGEKAGGVKKAVKLDVLDGEDWRGLEGLTAGEQKPYDFVFGSNFLHMVPFPEAPKAIFRHLTAITSARARFLIYGPFKEDAGFFSQADEEFDYTIRARPNGSYLGLRSIDAFSRLADKEGWRLEEKKGMPKGNWVLVFARRGQDASGREL